MMTQTTEDVDGHIPTPSQCAFLSGGPKKMMIGADWFEAASGKTFDTINPATEEVLAKVAEGDKPDVERAVAAARRAFEGPWSKWKPYARQQLLLKIADLVERNFEELCLIDTLDMGAPISRTLSTRRFVLSTLHYNAGMATAIHGETIENSVPGDFVSYTVKEPVGVVGAIIPWNGPLGAFIRKLAPVLATGCTLVLKPAEESPLSALRLGEILLEAGVPEGVINIVTGYGETAGAALAAHSDVDMLTFTGSQLTGQKIVEASAGNLKRLMLELGGKSPDIVFADADLDEAVPGAAMAVFANSGQICSAGTRLFVERKIYEEFVERVADFGRQLKVGSGIDPDVQVGPLVSREQLNRVDGYLTAGKREGARLVAGRNDPGQNERRTGYFVPPTVFTDVTDDMSIAREEIFGPVVSALPFEDVEEVVRRANSTPFGLGSGIWTNDVGKAHRVARAVRAGSVWVNCYHAVDPAVPFGGYKMSGYGRERGLQHIEEHLNVKSVWIKTGWVS